MTVCKTWTAVVLLGFAGGLPLWAEVATTASTPQLPREVYLGNDLSPDGPRVTANADGSLTVTCPARPATASATAVLNECKGLDGLELVRFELSGVHGPTASLHVSFNNRLGEEYQAPVSLPSSGNRAVVLPISAFKRVSPPPATADRVAPGDGILSLGVRLAGNTAALRFTLRDFTVRAGGREYPLFQPFAPPDPFPPAGTADQRPVPMAFTKDATPRVFIADGALTQTTAETQQATLRLAADYPGQFGVDMAYPYHPAIRETVRTFNANGIKTITETHLGFPYFTAYFTNWGCYLTRADGFNMNEPRHWRDNDPQAAWPYHGFNSTRQEVLDQTRRYVNTLLDFGFSEILLIDYIWPWTGRWGFGKDEVAQFAQDLNGRDGGLYLAGAGGAYRRHGFWEYLRLFTDMPITPEALGQKSWDAYQPAFALAGPGGTSEQLNRFLYTALYHYEYLKFAQQMGDAVAARGGGFQVSINPEDIYNGGDLYLLARTRGVAKVAYEYFGPPTGTQAWYHNMRWYSGTFEKLGKRLALCGEINGGGHGPSRYYYDAAYAFYYDITSCAKPIDYNNQYMEGQFADLDPDNGYHFKRYGHWAGGALAFLQSHRERAALQPPKATVAIASRGVLEYQPGFSGGMDQRGNLAALLDRLHYPFDSAGKEGMADFTGPARVLVYGAVQSSPRHFRELAAWLAQGRGKTLITHSLIPFDRFPGAAPEAGAGLGMIRPAGTPHERDIVLTSATGRCAGRRNVQPVAGGTAVLCADDGTPLVVDYPAGNNRLLYITADISQSREALDAAIAGFAMQRAGVTPEVTAAPTDAVHLYEVAGGRSCVAWNLPAVEQQVPQNYYARQALAAPAAITFSVPPNRTFVTYDFFHDRLGETVSSPEGKLTWRHDGSCDIFYFGPAGSSEFAATLAAARQTRAKLAAFKMDPPLAFAPLAQLRKGAPADARFLVFSGSMPPENKGKTDGVELIVKARRAGSPTFHVLARFTLDQHQPTPELAIPLAGNDLEELMLKVDPRTNPAFDLARLHKLQIVRGDGRVEADLIAATAAGRVRRGLAVGNTLVFDPQKVAAAKAIFAAGNGCLDLHPAWNGLVVPVVGVFDL